MRPAEHEGIIGVTFDSDGHGLVGVLYLARGGEPKPTVLLLHGCPGLEKNLDLAVALRDRGWNALLFHYRGSWGSGGRYDLRTIPRDVAAAVDHLRSGEHRTVDPDRIAVVGHSLGGWAAVLAAAGNQQLRAVAVCGAVTDLAAMSLSTAEIRQEITRFVAAEPAEFMRQRDEVAAGPQPLDVARSISPRPLLVVHGSDDEWVPAVHARTLHDRAGQPRRYVEVEGANHSFSWHRGQLRDLIVGWLAEMNV
jgi:dipeptidyl aminopeptidase/acylaminoacyl peptidase